MSDKKQKQKKPQKLKARLARGFPDRFSADIRATDAMMAKIKLVYERFGFEPVETPFVEYTDALGKFLPDQDRPNEGVFSFQDDDDQWLSLRYDLTAPLARHVAENFNDIQLPYRTYRAGWVFRNEKPGPGRFRQFMQFDADIVGAPGVQADAEMCMMMADTMEALGIKRGDYVIRVNNRKVLDGVMEAIGLGGDENAGKRLTVLRAIDKLDKFGIEGVKLLLGAGRWDGGKEGEGDFMPGASLGEIQVDTILKMIGETGDQYKSTEFLGHLDYVFEKSEMARQAAADIGDIMHIVQGSGYGPDRITADPSVVRGLEYYTGPVFEAELLFDVTNEKGQKVQFGSVGGGGRYDGLVSRFMGQPVPATGFLHRRLAADDGAQEPGQALRRGGFGSDPGDHHGPRPHRRLRQDGSGTPDCAQPAGWRRTASRPHRSGRAVPGQSQGFPQAAALCRPSRLAHRHHPGRRREG
jgi:histidyl-tRNA synthetase